MIKTKELSDPNSCMSRAKDDEMTFVLLARDSAAPATIMFWHDERIRLGKNFPGDIQLVEALSCISEMNRWRNAQFVQDRRALWVSETAARNGFDLLTDENGVFLLFDSSDKSPNRLHLYCGDLSTITAYLDGYMCHKNGL